MMLLKDIAEVMGGTVKAVTTLHHRSTRNRREGDVRPGDMPPPDQRVHRIPLWEEATVRAWLASRPNRPIHMGVDE